MFRFTILYVDQPQQSAVFYEQLFQHPPVEVSPTFALFAFENGQMLGLWSKHTVEPVTSFSGSGMELGWEVTRREQVDELFTAWKAHGISILQKPVDMDFGYTFVGLDPDQHRLRVMFLSPPSVA